jgi:hypothetical protein
MYRFSASLPIVAIINLPTNMNNQPKELFSYPSIQFVLKFVIYVIIIMLLLMMVYGHI